MYRVEYEYSITFFSGFALLTLVTINIYCSYFTLKQASQTICDFILFYFRMQNY